MTVDDNKEKPATEEKTEVNDKKKAEDDLSEEDKQLQDQLNLCIERLQESDENLYKLALDTLCSLIRSSTTSMTSVPKPLKFLLPHYDNLKQVHAKMVTSTNKRLCADIISVLAMTRVDLEESKRDTLLYRFQGSHEPIGAWGHEYVRHLTGQVALEWDDNVLGAAAAAEKAKEVVADGAEIMDTDVTSDSRSQLLSLVEEIVPYHISHNAESEAIDLCIEIGRLDLLRKHTTDSNYQRVCLYLISCVPYLPDEDWTAVLDCARLLYLQFHDHGNAMRCALKLNKPDVIAEQFVAAQDAAQRKQLAFLLGRHQYVIEWDSESMEDGEDLIELMANARLNEYFVALGRELDIMEPKIPEDVYKSHLEPNRPGLGGNIDSARQNLAASYVNGLVNCAYGKDKLLMDDDGKMRWIYKNKDVGMMSTVATLGWLLLWDVDAGLSQIDKYLYSSEDYIKAGGLLACGVVNSGVKNECDPAFALLAEYVDNKTCSLSRAAIIGLGVAYAGSGKKEVSETLLSMVTADDKVDASCMAALSCGMVNVGSLNDEVTSTILQTMLERPASHWDSPTAKLMALGLGLTCLGRQEDAEVILASLEAVAEPMRSMAHLLVDVCAYAGTGNVLKIQHLLHILSEKFEGPDGDKSGEADDKNKTKAGKKGNATTSTKDDKMDVDLDADGTTNVEEDSSEFAYIRHQGLAALGVAVIAMGEDVGTDMAFRMFGHLLRFGEGPIKRAVPLALSLCYASNPQVKVLDMLSKFSHDADQEISYNAILAMGIVGAGTNNARLAAMLRQLAVYHSKDPFNLFMVRLAQGLTHLGKGTLTLSPFHSDRFLMAPTAVAGLMALLVSALDIKKTLLGRLDYLIFYLTPAIQPRLLMTFDEDLASLPVSVRVGHAVDVVGQAGRPKTITGFQTHTTPVLLAYGERAELATEEYEAVTQAPLEGFVLLKKNPNYKADQS